MPHYPPFLVNAELMPVYTALEQSEKKVQLAAMDKIEKTDAEWREQLNPMQYHVLREAGTERAFTGVLTGEKRDGRFYCAGCGSELFESENKFESGCGWPSFTVPTNAEVVIEHIDTTYGMVRTEVRCAKCDGHLGHVFPDGPSDRGGLRYCINSAALEFESNED